MQRRLRGLSNVCWGMTKAGPTCMSSGSEILAQVVGQGMEPVHDPTEFSSGTTMWAQE